MFSFVKNRFYFYALAFGLFLFSIVSPWIFNLNQGIDMTGGVQIEYNVDGVSLESTVSSLKETIIPQVKNSLPSDQQAIITDTLVYQISGTKHIVVEAGINEAAAQIDGKSDLPRIEAAKTAFNTAVKKELDKIAGATVIEAQYRNVGASFGDYIKKSGYLTLILAIIAISLYIQYAFRGSIAGMASWPFAVVTTISLAHDVVIAFGLYVVTSHFFPEFKIDTFFITAMLTVLGYSINDTIVVMDRIRSNLQHPKTAKGSFSSLIDTSIWDTMRRSLFTTFTIVIVLVAMFFFGPESIKGFTLALIFGTLVGAYSSICIASPLLVDLTGKK
ncbi:protein translocase subunit SecF [Candidatus Gracilibacteria bacterium]|nr:protein translocase subunit SecF [Candidatus Gracilibacteria bacterium]